MPSLTSGCPNFACSEAIRTWQAMASSQPPPSAKPFTAATVGLGDVSKRRNTSCPRRERRLGSAELCDGRVAQRVELVRPIDRDGGDAVGDGEGQELVGHREAGAGTGTEG